MKGSWRFFSEKLSGLGSSRAALAAFMPFARFHLDFASQEAYNRVCLWGGHTAAARRQAR
jgi:hypothetical protein